MGIPLEELRRKGIAFVSGKDRISFMAHCLADGLSSLSIPVRSSISFEDQQVCDFRFEASSDHDMATAAFVVVDLFAENFQRYTPFDLEGDSRRMIFLSNADEVCAHPVVGGKTFIAPHENRFLKISGKRIPWAFGLSQRMIEFSQEYWVAPASRERKFVCNFRPSPNQSVRGAIDLSFVPLLERYFEIDRTILGNSRWNAEYYQHLADRIGCLAYGGAFMQDTLRNEYFRNNPQLNSFYSNFEYEKPTVVGRWDSWRFWESLVMGCLTVQLDFEEYGFSLPVMPQEGVHYIGVKLQDPGEAVDRIASLGDRAFEIMESGRAWAIEHYSPKAVAQRFLDTFFT